MEKNIIKMVQSFYCRSNSILTNFNMSKYMDVKKLPYGTHNFIINGMDETNEIRLHEKN